MLSIIICSRNELLNSNLQQNIANTIGCKYEIIVIDNSINKYSIFEAYNIGISKSKGEILCYLHDDIVIHTNNWGILVTNIFSSNASIGLIGIAGSKIKTQMPSAWWDCEDKYKRMHLIQHFPNNIIKNWQIGWQKPILEEVVVIDGVFMVSKKNDKIRFNENLKGFHCYDLNLCFEYIKNGFKVMVTKEILIEHFSKGKLDKSWYVSTLFIHKTYKNILPLSTDLKYDIKKQNFKNGTQFSTNLLTYKLKKESFIIWLKLIWLKPISKFHLQFIKMFLN